MLVIKIYTFLTNKDFIGLHSQHHTLGLATQFVLQ